MKAWILGAVLTLTVSPLAAGAANAFPGTWRGMASVNGMSCTITVAMTAHATYSQIAQCGGYATGQSGPYRVFPNGTITLDVTDWTPRRRLIHGAYGDHFETNAQPAGGSYAYTFKSPNTMVWRDIHYNGVITFHRVH